MSSESSSNRLRILAPHLSDAQFEATQIYTREVLRFNKTLNLISPATMARVDAVHILDTIRAWTIVEPLIRSGATVLDFGSGNGLPGLLSAALSPDRSFRLIDRDERKMEFCKHTAHAMGLKNLSVSVMDVGDIPDASVEFAISRGFASVTKSLLLTRSTFKTDGSFFMMKGDSWSIEMAELPPRLFGSWKVAPVGNYQLPDIAAEFVILQCRKLAEPKVLGKS